MTRDAQLPTHVDVIARRDAFAAGREASQGSCKLIPSPRVGVELEACVGLGIKAFAIPQRRGNAVVRLIGDGSGAEPQKKLLKLHGRRSSDGRWLIDSVNSRRDLEQKC